MARKRNLPISNRPIPDPIAWLLEDDFLLATGSNSQKTESTYRSGLRLFADWLQHFQKASYNVDMNWPLSPAQLDTETIIEFRAWLSDNRSRATVMTYTAALVGYLNFIDEENVLPSDVELAKLHAQMAAKRVGRDSAETVLDFDKSRQHIPQIIQYYEKLPLPRQNDRYNRRLSLLRDRAVIHTLYSTAARISELVSLDRASVRNGAAQFVTIESSGKLRDLAFEPYAQASIRAYLRERKDDNPALFIAHSRNAGEARLSITSVHNVVKRAVRALNLNASLSAHDFRHYRATQLLRDGMSLAQIQELLGHSDIATTRNIYAPVLEAR
jgi:site-specific recombinase XerD